MQQFSHLSQTTDGCVFVKTLVTVSVIYVNYNYNEIIANNYN